MSEYLCILGRELALSAAELEAVLPGWNARVVSVGAGVLRITTDSEITGEALKRLGGTLKLARVSEEVPAKGDFVSAVLQTCTSDWLADQFPDNRIEFGVSVYGASGGERQKIHRHFLAQKKNLKALKRPARYVTSRDPQLSTVTVHRQGLVKNGKEFILYRDNDDLVIGATLAVQDYQAYALRDRGRPAADPRSGMLPPKVAQIMVNLSGIRPDDVLLDPFCGSGTILQEAAMLGVRKIFGSDSEAKAVKDSQENLRWLLREFPELKTDIEITKRDVRSSDVRPSVIVTEPFLGKPLSGKEAPTVLRDQLRFLEKLYSDAFRSWGEMLPEGGRVVMIWPAFVIGDKQAALDLEDVAGGFGFRRQAVLSERSAEALNNTERYMVGYGRPDARLRRQIRKWVR